MEKSAVWSGIYDVVNVSDSELRMEAHDLKSIGASPIIINPMNNGIDYMVNELRMRVATEGTIDLLRIHGHGGPGIQTLSCSRHLFADDLSSSRAIISTCNYQQIETSLGSLRSLFAPNAEVWLMGCEVGADYQGHLLIGKLAKLWRIKVIAGIPIQMGGNVKTYGLEGKTATAHP